MTHILNINIHEQARAHTYTNKHTAIATGWEETWMPNERPCPSYAPAATPHMQLISPT